jgi:hypothetical protein
MKTLPDFMRRLFWDVDPDAVDVVRERSFVLDRVLEYGGIEAVDWAEDTYGTDGLRDYFLTRGDRVLSAKTRSFWRAMFNLTDDSCTTKSSTTFNNPLWPY